MLTRRIVSRPTTVLIVFILLFGLGVFALLNLPIALLPEINPPIIVVLTVYPGAGPEEVERSVSRPLEATLSGVSGMENVSSISQSNMSILVLEFTFGTNLYDATNSIRDSLEMVRMALPDDAEPPMIFRVNMDMMPIMGLMVTGNRSSEELRELAEDTIVPRIEQTPGISTANVMGGRERIIRVELPQSRLEAYDLTVTQIQQMLSAQNLQIPAGRMIEDNRQFLLTTMGEFESLDDIRNTVITFRGGGFIDGQISPPIPIFLRDIADVFESFRDETSAVYVDGVPSVMMTVQQQTGGNAVQAARALRNRIERMNHELPPDIHITEIFNTTDIIENSINQVTGTAVSGAILAIVVLFVFLRSVKPTLIIGISIPICIIITMMVMYFFGLTLNLMTMAGLVLGIGMLIDNSIVILENIYRYRERESKLRPAAILGTSEMLMPIAASTLTTICVFLPLVMFQDLLGVAGEMFAGLAFTVVISLAVSFFTAAFLVPVLSSHYFPLVTRIQKPLTGRLVGIDNKFSHFFTWLDNSYRKSISWVLGRKKFVVFSIFLLFVGSILLVSVVGWVFMPQQEDDSVVLNLTLPEGTPLPETVSILQQIELIARNEITGFERMTIQAGAAGGFMGGGNNTGSLRIQLPPFADRVETAEEIQEILRRYFYIFPGASFNFGGGGGMGATSPVEIVLRIDDLERGKIVADRIADLMRERLSDYVTEPQVDLTDGLPQIEIVLDRERMYHLGLNVATIGMEIRAAVDGVIATQLRTAGRDYDVLLILAEADRSSRPSLDHIFVSSPIAGRVPLSNFAHYEEGTGPLTIRRENQSRVIRVTAGSRPGVNANILQERVQSLIRTEIPVEEDLIIEFGGDHEEMMEMMGNFVLIALVAIFLVFGILASLFESFRDPFIIIFTLPLSFIGIVMIYLITGEPFNVLSAVGLLVLLGIITNNGIVLVDYTNLLRKRGYSLRDACVEAAGNRLRPILMTTVTTVVGLAPMAFFPGEGSELVAPIGKTVLGGLSFGTLMTLFLLPVIYFIINRRSNERIAKAEARRQRIALGLKKKDAAAAALPAFENQQPGEVTL